MRMMRVLGVVAVMSMSGTAAVAQATFMSFPANHVAQEVSADGSVVVGGVNGGGQAFRWTEAGGFAFLGAGVAWGVSGDGDAIAINNNGGISRWTPATGAVGLPISGAFSGAAPAISRDGSTVVCGNQRWNSLTGTTSFPLPAGFATGSFSTNDVSNDGSVVTGGFGYGTPLSQPFRWTAAGGTQLLGHIPGGAPNSAGTVISGDGSQIAGMGQGPTGFDTFRWTQPLGMVGLGVVAAGFGAPYPRDMTPDGNVLVGTAGFTAFVWSGAGPENLQEVLERDFGLNLNGYELQFVNGVSDDGRTLVGLGHHPSGFNSGWVVHLPSTIPAPGGGTLLAMALVIAARRRRARVPSRAADSRARS